MNDFFAWFKTVQKKSFLDGSVIVDVGAYQGLFTEQLIKLHKFDQAFLFEPHPKNFQLLKEKKVLRGFLWSWSPKTGCSLPHQILVGFIYLQINLLLMDNPQEASFMRH